MTAFPGALPAAGSASASDTLAAAGHTALHNGNANEIRAIATKVGTGASTATAGTALRGTGAGTSAFGQIDLTTDVTGVLPTGNLPLTTLLATIYPVGSIYISTSATNPGTTFGFGTWAAYAAGRTLIGVGTSDAVYAAAASGGESTHVLSSNEMPSHTHIQDTHSHNVPARDADDAGTTAAVRGTDASVNFATSSTVATNQNTGGGAAHNNLPPYITAYMWQRTA